MCRTSTCSEAAPVSSPGRSCFDSPGFFDCKKVVEAWKPYAGKPNYHEKHAKREKIMQNLYANCTEEHKL
jgi:hypothetical protein